MRQDKKVKRIIPISWRKLIPGVLLLAIGLFVGSIYISDNKLIVAGMTSAIMLASGGFLVYHSLKSGASGFSFQASGGKNGFTGRENTIILFAVRDHTTKKDVPLILKFLELKHPPKGARLHYVRCLKKHFYELFNDNETHKLSPIVLKDKKSFPPELFKIPAVMQTYKDALEYSPPTLLQKIAPGILLGAIGLVGILMVMTGG